MNSWSIELGAVSDGIVAAETTLRKFNLPSALSYRRPTGSRRIALAVCVKSGRFGSGRRRPAGSGGGSLQVRNMDEGREPFLIAGIHLERPPECIIADITPGIARKFGWQAVRAAGEPQSRGERRRKPAMIDPTGDRPRRRDKSAGIGKERHQVARPCLDADMARARREPEHQDDVGIVRGDQGREVAVDRGIARREDMRCDPHTAQGRAACPCQPFDQRAARIGRRARKRPEAGDQYGYGLIVWASQFFRLSMIFSENRFPLFGIML